MPGPEDQPNPSPSPGDQPGLQFDRAEFARPGAAAAPCQFCGAPIVDSYYEANGRMACATCRDRLAASAGGELNPARIGLAFLLGLAAAAVGAAIYFAVAVLTGYEFSIIAILVGYLVGTAVRRGAGGVGGPVYQGLALLLTYAAIIATYFPLSLRAFASPAIWWRAALAPFQEGSRSILGLVIIAIALYEAWRLTSAAHLHVTGPYPIADQRGDR